ncbi:MAG TPA: MotA/TolQ/ExbB proton channel family protein [Lacunisphaera sp.]|nr:MotA/TolQ/ExbB proton channel family protein [Lacunisphaera sp.]
MNDALHALVQRGGPAVVAIMALSVVLYSHCFHILLGLRRGRFNSDAVPAPERLDWLQRRQWELRDDFRQQRVTLGAMIAAAPLLGLLGTVSGMVKTFESLSTSTGQKSMEGLAGGISEVLVATESGLSVAIPAMMLVYFAHRQMTRRLHELNQQEEALRGGVAP